MTEGELEVRDWPELLGEAPAMRGTGCPPGLPRLKRAQGSRHLGVDLAFNADTEHGGDGRNKHFTSSDEDLIKRILTDGHPFFPQADGSDMADLSSIFEDHTEVILLQKLNEPLPLESVRRDPPKTAFTSNTVVTDVCRPRRFPPVCGRAALWGSWTGIAVASGVSMWAGHGFTQNVAMLWLISCFAGFLCSCLLLEPIKVVCEAVYYAAYVRRLRPEDQDVLVEFPRVERVVQRVSRVRPPQGFALSQARQQARKVHMLHTMLKNFLVYMFFLLVVLLLNYADSGKHTHSLRLRNQLQRGLHTPDYHSVSSRGSVLVWLNQSLLPRLLDDSVLLRDTGSVFLGTLRLRQTRDEQNDVVPAAGGNSWIASSTGTTGNATVSGNSSAELLPVRDGSEVEVQLNRSLAEACSTLWQLQQRRWINHRTRSVLVEFSLYNINTNLLAVFSFLLEFPVSDRALPSMELHVITLWPFRGLDLQLLLTVVLLALVFYFLVPGIAGFLRDGFAYLLCVWRVLGICKLALAACVCGLHLSRCAAATQLWTLCLKHLHHDFTDFQPLARQTRLYTLSGALLLFVLVLKVSHQLRFLREWAVFGRALHRSSRELLAAAAALLLLLLAYAHAGHLLLHSVADGYSSVASAGLSLVGAGGRALLSWRPCWTTLGPPNPTSSLVLHTSFALLRLLFLWVVISVLLRNYQRARAELYCPAVDLQDYEMVELFLRRLKMWMGLSRAKEFRHKVRFEGMELPPSRSSSTSDCKSLCLPPLDAPESPPTPDSIDAGSEASWRPASSSPCSFTEAPGGSLGPGLGLGLHISPGVVVGNASWRERAETEASLKRLLPTLDALLQQLDRVTVATEDVYHVECRLERAQSKRGRAAATEKGGAARVSSGGERGEEPGRWRERKRGKEKQSVGKTGKKVEKSELCKDGRASASLRKAPAAATGGSTGGSSRPPFESQLPQAHTPAVPPSTPAPTPPPPLTPIALNWDPPTDRDTLPSSSLFNHPAHTTIIPTRKRKRKTPPLKNKVHPNLDKHGPGPPKP